MVHVPMHRQRWEALATHRTELVRLARARGAGDDAEDVVHTALARLVVRSDLDLATAPGYLRATVVNLCRDLHAGHVRRRTLSTHHGLIPRPRDPADQVCDTQEAVDAVRELAQLLSPEVVAVCRRLAAAELTWREAAEELGEPEPALRSRVRRAYHQVRKRVQEWRRQ